jgi:phytoene dehydrogenase-like protein
LLHSPLAETARRVRQTLPGEVDVAIVGCGLGGLEAGALLARAGWRVACFDQHYVAGGCATMFERGRSDARFRFDVGLHYVGDCGPDGLVPQLLQRAGVTVDWRAMDPDGFDHLVFPDLTFRVPVGLERYRQRLKAAFPAEKRGIDRYCDFVAQVGAVQARMAQGKGAPSLATLWHIVWHGRLLARYRQATVAQLLDDCTRDPALRAVLLGQSGDYGVRPSQASAVLHAGLAHHYFLGAWYPKGGGQVLADGLAAQIEAHGGSVHLRCPVRRIQVRDSRAVGVEVEPHGGEVQAVSARVVVSAADLRHTWLELLGPEHLPRQVLERAGQLRMASALFLLCLGIRGDLRQRGLGAHNIWQFDQLDVEATYRAAEDEGRLRPTGCYITSACAKDPDTPGHAPEGITGVEVMALVPGKPESWGVTALDLASGNYRRHPAYLAHKAEVEADLVARLDRQFPGAAQAVVFQEGATPLTHWRFTQASGGSGYGLAATPDQFFERRPGYRGPVAGLFQAGANTRAGHGIVGALTSGLRAAERVAVELGRPFT